MLAEDIEAGKGHLRIRQSDTSKFTLGVNMAATPGKVVFRNDLIELIQYAPTTEMVDRRPLLIVPPWINKYYILDLGPEKSFVRWAVAQGLTVFMVSWVNPDQRLAHKNFEDYLREGIFAALDAIEQATGERHVATVGYCVGGTLLATALAYMAAKGDDRITSATFLGAQVDFTWRRRPQDLHRRGPPRRARGENGRNRLSRWRGDGLRLQHAAAERPDLVLCREQLSEGPGAVAIRSPHLEFRLDADAGGKPSPSICAISISTTSSPRGRW